MAAQPLSQEEFTVVPIPVWCQPMAHAAGVAWRILTDTREWPIWGPSVRAVDAPSHLIGPSMRGRIQTPVGLWLPFEITRREPEHACSWRVAGVEATGHRIDPLDPGRCRVTFEIPRWASLRSCSGDPSPTHGMDHTASDGSTQVGRTAFPPARSPGASPVPTSTASRPAPRAPAMSVAS